MTKVSFTTNLKRHVDCPPSDVAGNTVRAVLDQVFVESPNLRSYILDDQGCLRKHMVIFVDGQTLKDRKNLSDSVSPSSEIYVMQALSGG